MKTEPKEPTQYDIDTLEMFLADARRELRDVSTRLSVALVKTTRAAWKTLPQVSEHTPVYAEICDLAHRNEQMPEFMEAVELIDRNED